MFPRSRFCHTIVISSLLLISASADPQLASGQPGFGEHWVRTHPFTIGALNFPWKEGSPNHGKGLGEALFLGAGLNTSFQPDPTLKVPVHMWGGGGTRIDIKSSKETVDVNRRKYGDQIAGWIVNDEAPAKLFPDLSEVMRYIRQVDPGKPVYVSFSSSFAWSAPKADAFRKAGIDILNPDILLAFDYPFVDDGKDHFYNDHNGATLSRIMTTRKMSISSKRPFHSMIQSFAYTQKGEYYLPNETQFRALAYAYLTGGAKGMDYFTYEAGTDYISEAMVSMSGVKSSLYPIVAQVNAEIKILGETLKLLDSTDVKIVLGQRLNGSEKVDNALPDDIQKWTADADNDQHILSITPASPVVASKPHSADLLVGLFRDDDNQRYFMLTNLMHGRDLAEADSVARFEVKLDPTINAIYRLNPDSGQIEEIKLTDHRLIFDYAGGKGQLFSYSGKFAGLAR